MRAGGISQAAYGHKDCLTFHNKKPSHARDAVSAGGLWRTEVRKQHA